MDPCASLVSKLVAAALVFGTCLSLSVPAHADRRVALVIGNSAYKSVPRLDNPKNDATLMAETLRSLGFTLVGGGAQLDLDKSGIDRAVQNFGDLLPGADVGLFWHLALSSPATRMRKAAPSSIRNSRSGAPRRLANI
jgi:Caspase domain